MHKTLILCAALVALAGCSTPKRPDASPEAIAAAAYREPGPATITLLTVINNRTGSGGHSALMINASERIIFDPAGSFYADVVPEREDVLFGITPAVERAYRGGHARSTYHVVSQTVEVTPEQAQTAYQLALSNGRVPGAFCSNATSTLLQKVPGFEHISVTFYPNKLSDQFAQIPGVVSDKLFENDSDDLQQGLAANNAALNG